MPSSPLLQLENISKGYLHTSSVQSNNSRSNNRNNDNGEETCNVLENFSMDANPGEVIAITGKSGSGKSTLLHIAGLLLPPSSGNIIVAGTKCNNLPIAKQTIIRRENISFVYQFHYLLHDFSVLENLNIPQFIRSKDKKSATRASFEILQQLNLYDKYDANVDTLSGGEKQRVAIARALVVDSKIILADEPTGSLDAKNTRKVFDSFYSMAKTMKKTIIAVTHDPILAGLCDRQISLD